MAGAPDESSATRRAVEWATEALEAEIGVVLEQRTVLASVGFPRGQVPDQLVAGPLSEPADIVDVPTLGRCRVASAGLDADGVEIVVARAGTDPFSREEVGLLRAAARSLTLTLRLLRALAAERLVRDSLQKRQALLERLAGIQRSIARQVPLTDVLHSITSSARDLLDVEMATLRLVDPKSPREMLLAASEGLPPEIAAAVERIRVGVGTSGRAVAEDRLVIMEGDAVVGARPELSGQNVSRAMAAPVREGEHVIGTILVATTRPEHVFDVLEQEAILAFAEHASLALTDARRVEHIRRLAFHDELTGLPNRGLFLERLGQALIRARRRGGGVAVLYLDLDRFKTINDSLGHTAGDQLLVTVAERLLHCLRDEDTASRLGGDEFAVLAQCDRAGAIEIAERILQAMEPPFVIDEREVSAAASIGIALDWDGEADAGRMLRDADTAMYRAKFASGGGFVVFEQSMHAAALARIDLEADLRRAVFGEEMHLDFQPIIKLADQRTVGFEALVRWTHRERGLLSPLEFIPLAEETGQISGLGRWTLIEACRQAREWQMRDPRLDGLSVSVNVSPRQLQDRNFEQDVADALDASGLDPTTLVLEITENAVMADVEATIARLLALRDLGVSLAVDDFGTGHSSLALLRRLPVEIIKVDKMFVDPISHDHMAAAFLETIVRMAEILSLTVVVEGIESAAQADILAGFGGVYGQGYHLGRPMSAADVGARLTALLEQLNPASVAV